MIMTRALVFAAFALLVFAYTPVPASALSVGLAPAPALDAGDMLPGDSKSMEFFIMSDHDDDVLVSLSVNKPSRMFFDPSKGRFRYGWIAEESSEEDMTGWITVLDDSVIVPPEKELKYLKNGGLAYANKKVELIITVPDDAEPGYHSAVISPYPRISSQAGGTGLGIITVSEMSVVMNVLGRAERNAEIAGITFTRDSPGYGTIRILIKNKGSVTLSAAATSIRVYDSQNKTVLQRNSPETHIAPGSVGSIDIRLDTHGLEGTYWVDADVEWITGEGSFSGEIDIGEYVAPPVTGDVVAPPAPATAFPMWMIPVILAALGALVYWRIR